MCFFRAFVYLSQNNYTEAHATFLEVLKIDPTNPVVSGFLQSCCSTCRRGVNVCFHTSRTQVCCILGRDRNFHVYALVM